MQDQETGSVGEKSVRQEDHANGEIAAERRWAAAVAQSGGLGSLRRMSTTLEHLCGVLSAHLEVAPEGPERDQVDHLYSVVGTLFVAIRLQWHLHRSPSARDDGPEIGR